jgi:hypothetical protein
MRWEGKTNIIPFLEIGMGLNPIHAFVRRKKERTSNFKR